MNSELIRTAQQDMALRGVATDLEFVARTRVGSVLLRGRSTESGDRVIVKLRIQEMERAWMTGLSEHAPEVVPRVFGTGDLGGAGGGTWIVLEELQPVDRGAAGDARSLARTAARFQEVATTIDAPHFPPKDIAFFRSVGQRAGARGLAGTDRIVDRLAIDFPWISSVADPTLGHGDLSFNNALRRGGDVVLIDPLPSIAPWPLDAAWCEVSSGGSDTQRLVPLLAAARTERGLPSANGADLERVEIISRAWASMLAWAMWPRMEDDEWVRSTTSYAAAVADL